MPQSLLETKPLRLNLMERNQLQTLYSKTIPNFSDTFTELIVTSMFKRSNQSILNDNFQLVVKLIPILT
jgi:hypothetical protein